ncbi:MAG TPA: hypothetical protein VNG33_06600 [Polyangiaceae bacterium]|nr:hypothetical protein [Polyangiaceae bacterium]
MRFRAAPLALLLTTELALARPHVRRHFEPTDLELEDPGTSELDLETGFVRSQGPWRMLAPDFELDLGVAPWLELDVDGAYAIEGAPGKPFSFDHAAPDPLWPSVKVGLLDLDDAEATRTYAVGAQLGPKLATFPSRNPLGVEALLLGGVSFGGTRLALNLGGFVDPSPDQDSPAPIGIETGFDWEHDLDAAARYMIGGELSSVVFRSADPAQLQLTFGPSYAATEWLDLSITGLVGFLRGSDRYGVTLGVAPHLPLWKGAQPPPDKP